MATLIVLQGPDKGRTFQTRDEDVIVVGRGSPQLPLTDQTISRRHAELLLRDGHWVLADLRSANGTYVNGVHISKPTRLKYGDQIRVGTTLMVYAGSDSVRQLAGPSIPSDLVRLDAGSPAVDSSVVAMMPSSEDSLVLAAAETAYAVKAWNTMRELFDVIGRLLPPEQLLARILDIVFEETEVDRAVVFMCDEATGELSPAVVRYRDPAQAKPGDGKTIIASHTIMKHVMDSRTGVLSSNVVGDTRFASGKSVHNLGMRSVICVPIVAREQVLGIIHLDCPVTRHTYNEHELRLITAIGYQTGLAIENARLVESHLQRERLAAAGETVAYVSHYIKNVLQGMRGGADVLERGLQKHDLDVAAQGWKIVERNLDRSYNLMLNMLAFSKQREPRVEMLQVNRVVEEVAKLLQKQADDQHIVLLTDLDDHAPPVPADYDGVHQVVLNLITNAIDAVAAERGMINVRTRFDAGRQEMMISVTDNGPGVPAELRRKIFEPFHSTKGHGGTGLGLAVARKIVGELEGRIELAAPPDGGAEFRVYMPAAGAAQPQTGDTLVSPP